jgi:two-component system, OmpR family, sensor histidine kinase MprB
VRALSFRKRLTLFSAAGIALVLLIGSAATYLIMRSQLRGQIDTVLREQAQKTAPGSPLQTGIIQKKTAKAPGIGRRPKGSGGLQVSSGAFGSAPVYTLVFKANARPLQPAGAVTLPVSTRARDVARSGQGDYYTDVHVRGTHLRMYVSSLGNGYAVAVASSLGEVDRALSRLAWSLGITCLVGIIVAAIVGAVVARGALRPVRRLTDTAERITDTHDLGDRIETDGDDELGRLGATFNAMLDSLDGAIRSQRQLVSDASHELRTPLTSLRTNIDLLRQGVALSDRDRERLLRDIGNELEELTTLVANLVDLARGSQRDLHLRPVRLDHVGEVVVRRAEARFRGLAFTLDAEATTVAGDPEDLDRAIWNLVENAAKWTDGVGRVDIAICNGEVTVRDHGPGVPAEDRPFIFDRFYRSEAARSCPGSGLGLAIVRQIAETHGGRIDVEAAEGGGARFRLSLMRWTSSHAADAASDAGPVDVNPLVQQASIR